jgi:hypothetical protein
MRLPPQRVATHHGKLTWALATGGAIESSPAIGANGTVYIGSCDGYPYALGD